ncbi:MAG TPA: SseB family protein [Pyrinomonadaceae bacterium]|nr:SseB family protein [Pyrinomonadaceae bacterium]
MEDTTRNDDGARPLNDVEKLLLDARDGRAPLADMLGALVSADLYVPSTGEVMQDGSGFTPLLFDSAETGATLTAVFTDPARAAAQAGRAKYLLQVNGRELLRRLPPGYGIVINPGHDVGMEIQPYGVEAIVRDFT